ncbi:MAG: acido-empty-quinoprotein group A, partial [Acidobacteria bacterium]
MTTCTTSWRICRRSVSAALQRCAAWALSSLAVVGVLAAQDAKDSWTTYHGDYSGRRHSSLTQMTPANVHQLTLAWAFATGQTQSIKATPILANGVIYISAPDHAWAIDARSAHQLWHYTYPANEGFHIGHRGMAIYNDSVFLTTPDSHLIALDAKDGKVKWNVTIADAKKGYWSTNAPLLIRDHLLVGVSG